MDAKRSSEQILVQVNVEMNFHALTPPNIYSVSKMGTDSESIAHVTNDSNFKVHRA